MLFGLMLAKATAADGGWHLRDRGCSHPLLAFLLA